MKLKRMISSHVRGVLGWDGASLDHPRQGDCNSIGPFTTTRVGTRLYHIDRVQ